MTTQIRNAAMVNLLRADFQARYEPQFALAQVISHMLALPGLRGFWPMSSFDENGNAYDLSGQGRTLTYNGNPTYNYDDLAPYLDFDGTGDYLSRADEAGLDILGTEAYVANPGLTLGGWFWLDALPVGTSWGFTGKWLDTGGSNQRSYLVFIDPSALVNFIISSDGTGFVLVQSAAVSATSWIFLVGRFVPSSEISIFVNNTEVVNTTSIPAAIFNSSAQFNIGAYANATVPPLNGRASLCFLCASALSDAIIGNLFQQSRALFGV
jgi:hypothetical protein